MRPPRSLSMPVRRALLCATAVALGAQPVAGQDGPERAPAPWYAQLRIRGYGQIRYNRLLESNPDFQCEQCDRSWGRDGGLAIRRARLIVQGWVHPRVFLYLQPDFASTAGSAQHVAQLRDWYADLGLDAASTWRVRMGQSKLPYSYEAMQSSQQRLPLDRADGTNSAHVNERDLGAFVYWAPTRVRERFAALVADGDKGSGDYGAFALGVYNGQGANRAEANDRLHVVARATWPFAVRGQVIEPSVAAYTGQYVLPADLRSSGVRGRADWSYRDARALVSLAIAPRPVGLLAEYNEGTGPEYDAATDSVVQRRLQGGFVTAMGRVSALGHQWYPFARWQAYAGGKKHERDARRHLVRDAEVGLEWQPSPAFELVVAWYRGTRHTDDRLLEANRQRGRLLRVQAQFNY